MFQNVPTPPIDTSSEFKFGGEDGKTKIDFVESQKALSEYSNRVLQAFTQTRERVFEIQNAIADTIPGVTRLGGNIRDVSKIISEVAVASRRNVLASKEDVEGLFALTQILGLSATELSNSFLDVGIGIEKIPEEFGKSIEYIQSIGGNARTIMTDVRENMGQMNRFQFNEGVQGLTKMAAQASMLRFDMSKTFTFAEELYKPERAIAVAAAFQRMGVAIGGLGDPLQLMNQSINDPSGLQDSLVEVSKQFTFLDKQTNTFKISRQGVLILKELGEQAGIDSKEMMKMGLAAAELDQRLSAINSAGLTIANEDDKQYLANIAKMEGGTYKVKIDENTTKELSQLNQEEFDELIKQQRDAPKGIEETAKASLRLDEIISKNVEAIKNAVVGEILTVPDLQDAQEVLRILSENVADKVGTALDPKGLKKTISDSLGDFKTNIAKSVADGGLTDPSKIFSNLFSDETTSKLTGTIEKKLTEVFAGSGEQIEKLKQTIQNMGTDKFSIRRDKFNPESTMTAASNERMTATGLSVGGTQGSSSTTMSTLPTGSRSSKVNFDGDVDINVKFDNLPEELSPLQRAEVIKTITSEFKRLSFDNYIKNIVNPRSTINAQ